MTDLSINPGSPGLGTVDEDARRAAAGDTLVRVDCLRRELDDLRGRKPWPR